MLVSLPLVQELHHPSMRDRHWQMLMKVCQQCCSTHRILHLPLLS